METDKKGQSTLEYIILVTAVIVVILLFVGTSGGGFQSTLNSALSGATGKMQTMSGRWAGSM